MEGHEKYLPIGATISTMIWVLKYDFNYFFKDNFWGNLLGVPLWIIVSILIAGLAMYVPAIIIYIIKERYSNLFENMSETKIKTIKIVAAIIVWIILAAIMTSVGQK